MASIICYCGKVAKIGCNRCGVSKYCSKKCKKKDRKRHNRICSVKLGQINGILMQAKNDNPICRCGKIASTECNQCGIFKYCSDKCKRKNQTSHNRICSTQTNKILKQSNCNNKPFTSKSTEDQIVDENAYPTEITEWKTSNVVHSIDKWESKSIEKQMNEEQVNYLLPKLYEFDPELFDHINEKWKTLPTQFLCKSKKISAKLNVAHVVESYILWKKNDYSRYFTMSFIFSNRFDDAVFIYILPQHKKQSSKWFYFYSDVTALFGSSQEKMLTYRTTDEPEYIHVDWETGDWIEKNDEIDQAKISVKCRYFC